MGKTIISEGKTSTEAIEKGLKELNVSKKDVDIKILKEENKKSFFNILAPRNVRVELTIKENIDSKKEEKREYKDEKIEINDKDYDIIKNNLNSFLEKFFSKINIEEINYEIIKEDYDIKINIKGKNINSLIGYRGETLNAFQTIVSRIGNKGLEKRYRIIVDIEGYRNKRIKALEDLAIKVSKTVEKNKKSITLEPMSAFERKIIHNKLQENPNVITHSIGTEPNRKIVIELK